MGKLSLVWQSAINSLGVVVYVAVVSWLMINGDKIFGSMQGNNLFGPMLFLMLFVVSATIVGLLVLGRPAYLFLNGDKKQAVTLLLYTVGWLFAITVLGFLSFAVI